MDMHHDGPQGASCKISVRGSQDINAKYNLPIFNFSASASEQDAANTPCM